MGVLPPPRTQTRTRTHAHTHRQGAESWISYTHAQLWCFVYKHRHSALLSHAHNQGYVNIKIQNSIGSHVIVPLSCRIYNPSQSLCFILREIKTILLQLEQFGSSIIFIGRGLRTIE